MTEKLRPSWFVIFPAQYLNTSRLDGFAEAVPVSQSNVGLVMVQLENASTCDVFLNSYLQPAADELKEERQALVYQLPIPEELSHAEAHTSVWQKLFAEDVESKFTGLQEEFGLDDLVRIIQDVVQTQALMDAEPTSKYLN